MAITLQNDIELPTATAVESYTIRRLGKNIVLSIRMAETIAMGENNDFGRPALKPAHGGRSWEISLNSGTSDGLAAMQGILGKVMIQFVENFINALGIPSLTYEEIVGAISQIDDIDSVIASELEKIEVKRRNGELTTPLFVMGDAPKPATPP
jgi:hypothetical protein